MTTTLYDMERFEKIPAGEYGGRFYTPWIHDIPTVMYDVANDPDLEAELKALTASRIQTETAHEHVRPEGWGIIPPIFVRRKAKE